MRWPDYDGKCRAMPRAQLATIFTPLSASEATRKETQRETDMVKTPRLLLDRLIDTVSYTVRMSKVELRVPRKKGGPHPRESRLAFRCSHIAIKVT